MHSIEPYYNWRNYYIAAEDSRSPFFGAVNSEFEFTHSIYNYLIHPQWDSFGSDTLYLKVLFVDYKLGFTVIELIGEWNDLLYNDIMFLKREVIEAMMDEGINKFILIGENVLNFHGSDKDYYQEWFEEAEDGWIACVNFRQHVLKEITAIHIDYYLAIGGRLDNINWRILSPGHLFQLISSILSRRLNP